MTVTISTPGSVGVTVPTQEDGLVNTDWNSQITSKYLPFQATAQDVDADTDSDAVGMSIWGYSKNLPDLGITPVLLATQTWTMLSDQPVQLAVSVSGDSHHWGATGTTRVAFDTIETQGLVVPPWPVGDVSHDNLVDANDIDQIYANFGGGARYDVNGDGVVDQTDVDYLVQNVLNTWYGDVNLDGKIGFDDLQVLLDNWNVSGTGWARGDLDGNGKTQYHDFQLLLDNWNPMGIHSPLTTPNGAAETLLSTAANPTATTSNLTVTTAATPSVTSATSTPVAQTSATVAANASIFSMPSLAATPSVTISRATAAPADLLSESKAQMRTIKVRRDIVFSPARQEPWLFAGSPDQQQSINRKLALRHQIVGYSLAALESDRIDILSPVNAPVVTQS
jgi:hypothetical protein